VPSTIATAVASYDAYLRDTCGLADATRLYRRRYAREFLETAFGSQPVTPAVLQPADVERFVTTRARKCRPASAQVLASSIRSWLRYQQVIGVCKSNLVAAVPRIRRWPLAALPSALTDEEVDSLIEAFDRNSPTGQRDYAMARCLVDLGLRATEVAHLQLDDVDWRQGQLRVAGSKSRRSDWLPMPRLLGRAIAVYLRQGRPKSAVRALFVRHHAPRGVPIRPSVVRLALQRAATAADLSRRWRGPHSLRHRMATRLLRGGASLKEVAELLRHRSFDTTAIYAKVDLDALSSVAMPWPGRTP
jgi:site-specific recombinase XerD